MRVDQSVARRAFSPGELVSYYSGQRNLNSMMFPANMTREEKWVAIDTLFGIGYGSPAWWEYPEVSEIFPVF